jgi:serine/threonine protein kinase
LADRIAHGAKLLPGEALDVADRVLDVLVASHARGILHRDIKPENLFLTTSGELKVLDFGIARLAVSELGPSETDAGTLLGTPAFMPPEQASGHVDSIDARTDVWAVGATMFTLLTGRFVHESKTRNEQLGLAMTASAPSLAKLMPNAPLALVRTVDRALAFAQDDRWKDASEMRAAVRWVRDHWAEIQTSPERIPDEWDRDDARAMLPTSTTVGDRVVESSKSPAPGRRRIAFTVASTALLVGAVLVHRTLASSRLEERSRQSRAAASPPAGSSLAPRAIEAPVRDETPHTIAEPAPSAVPVEVAKVIPGAPRARPKKSPESRASGVVTVAAPSVAPPEPAPARDLYDRRR